MNRRKFFKAALATGSVGAFAGLAYGHDVEPHELSVERVHITLKRLPQQFEGFTLALLSDFHYGNYVVPVLASAIKQANEAAPDLALLAGDYVTSHEDGTKRLATDADTCAQVLAQLRPRFGVLAILGNHDYAPRPALVIESLKHHGIQLLRNNAFPVETNNARLWIGGTDDVIKSRPDLDAAFKGAPQNEAKILLAHEPDFADDVSRKNLVDLQLSGHSHGGQVRLPLVGAPVLPPLGEKYSMGLYRLNGMQLYTTRGLGMISPKVRFNCPPELTLLTLHCAVGASSPR